MTVKTDDKGRIIIPKRIREKMGLKKGTKLKIVAKKDKIILKKERSIAEEYAGRFKPRKPIPNDIDEFLNTVIKKWWEKST